MKQTYLTIPTPWTNVKKYIIDQVYIEKGTRNAYRLLVCTIYSKEF
jgi:hypothetical protein